MRRLMLVAVLAAVYGTAPAQAHHSFSAEFDIRKPITITGKVTMVRWSNPHAWIYLDVTGDDGKVVNWAFETTTANTLYRRGWKKEDLGVGTTVTIEGWLARNGTPTANAGSIMLSDGRKLFAGPAPNEAPAAPKP